MNWNQAGAVATHGDRESLVQIADIHMRSGRLEEAEHYNRQAVSLDPNYFIAQNNLGNILRHTGRVAEAVV